MVKIKSSVGIGVVVKIMFAPPYWAGASNPAHQPKPTSHFSWAMEKRRGKHSIISFSIVSFTSPQKNFFPLHISFTFIFREKESLVKREQEQEKRENGNRYSNVVSTKTTSPLTHSSSSSHSPFTLLNHPKQKFGHPTHRETHFRNACEGQKKHT